MGSLASQLLLSQCNAVDHIAGGGSVSLTRVDSSRVEGTFDVGLEGAS